MNPVLFSVETTKAKIASGRPLLLAGDEQVLRQLPPGNWIAGTIPYFMTDSGGRFTQSDVFVTELPAYIAGASIQVYDEAALPAVYQDLPANGFGVIILPASSRLHLSFALHAPAYPDFAVRPLIGWVAGVALSEVGQATAKVFDGRSGTAYEQAAVVMHVSLPAGKAADIGILNIFKPGEGDHLTFPADGFSATDVLVNGQKHNLAEYLKEKDWDTRWPLVADYGGASINISFQKVEEAGGRVDFYAPVFAGIQYRHARPVQDYVGEFIRQMPQDSLVFSCNCILNYIYSELEGKQTGHFVGPITFGEVAYQLLNQTAVYLKVVDLTD